MGDSTMLDLENILNESDSYVNRVAEYLKHKTAPKPKNNNLFLLDGFDISLDLDVDLIKLPPKQTLQEPQKADETKKQPTHETTKNLLAPDAIDAAKQKQSASSSAKMPNTSTSPTPRKTTRRSSSVPGSDRLRRAAMIRRSHSLGRRDLMKEFENVSVVDSNFLPAVSSTPAIDTRKYPQQIRQERETFDRTTAAMNCPLVEQFETNFTSNLQHLGRSGEKSIRQSDSANRALSLTLARSKKAEDSRKERHTYTIQAGPQPGQLLLSPSSRNSNSHLRQRISQSLRQSKENQIQEVEVLNPLAAGRDVIVPDTPPRMIPHSQPNPEHIVPESPTQREPTLQNVLHNISNSATSAPFMVVPMACISSKSIKQEAAPAAETTREKLKKVTSRSIQTSCSPQIVENVLNIMTDDESNEENETSTMPLNLAPSGSNSTRQRRLRKRRQYAESPVQLLNLHRTRSRTAQNRMDRRTVLNKPNNRPINGEEFAAELVRMSNYEILDLRKRNSQGLLRPLNGHKRNSKQILEEHIEQEMLRRKLSTPVNLESSPKESTSSQLEVPTKERSPSVKTAAITEEQSVDKERISPVKTRNSSQQKQESIRGQQYQKRQLPSRRNGTTAIGKTFTLPAAPPDSFRDSPMTKQASVPQVLPTSPMADTAAQVNPQITDMQETLDRQHRSIEKRLQKIGLTALESDKSTSTSLQPVKPPLNFHSPEKQLSTPHRRKSTRSQKSDMAAEYELLAICTPPAAFNHSIRQEEQPIVELPPEELKNKQAKINANNEEQQLFTQLLSPTHNHENELQVSVHMEEMQTETRSSSPLRQLENTAVEVQPSTSKGAMKKNQRENNKEKKESEQVDTNPNDQTKEQPASVFKKPTAPAPRRNKNQRSKLEKALDKIRIGSNDTRLELDTPNDSTDTIRKSKRGHVPLQNTWVHTVADPFAFMRKQSEYSIKSAANKSKKIKAESTATIVKRPPLCSSTPLNVDASTLKHLQEPPVTEQHSNKQFVSSEQLEQQNDQQVKVQRRVRKKITQTQDIQVTKESEQPDQATEKKEPKQKAKKKDKKKTRNEGKGTKRTAVTASEESASEISAPTSEPEFAASASEPEFAAPASEPEIDIREAITNNTNGAMECVSSSRAADRSIPLISWLRGDSIAPADTNCDVDMDVETNAVIISRASNLQFSNVEGVDYSFYKTGDPYMLGYMRFKPLQTRGFKRAKNSTLVFVALDGQFILETSTPGSDNVNQYPLFTGDTVEIKNGSRYNLTNRLDSISVIMVYRK